LASAILCRDLNFHSGWPLTWILLSLPPK
jgi:hypothetical protein